MTDTAANTSSTVSTTRDRGRERPAGSARRGRPRRESSPTTVATGSTRSTEAVQTRDRGRGGGRPRRESSPATVAVGSPRSNDATQTRDRGRAGGRPRRESSPAAVVGSDEGTKKRRSRRRGGRGRGRAAASSGGAEGSSSEEREGEGLGVVEGYAADEHQPVWPAERRPSALLPRPRRLSAPDIGLIKVATGAELRSPVAAVAPNPLPTPTATPTSTPIPIATDPAKPIHAAYAGADFQNSPAAHHLPIPIFARRQAPVAFGGHSYSESSSPVAQWAAAVPPPTRTRSPMIAGGSAPVQMAYGSDGEMFAMDDGMMNRRGPGAYGVPVHPATPPPSMPFEFGHNMQHPASHDPDLVSSLSRGLRTILKIQQS
ncbi:hypothetical protein BDK51DRAFT_30951 [Blyttiomyces helicus]|uniref:Uncharacterized protein n=1 Tax=Blyttiomyces helicus TaxID=388810 RepID=A0A4P9W7U7_9FUNG|nr:hypothetical protein BDK51DRAFT_30951 [Blyttiomyces helicus]|eukprot:RKO88559.1 hypothetical protein BDK51DRAFT_30951 [Blyttiomyces helicus]